MKITIKSLKLLHAYEPQVALFEQLYPDGVELPDSGQERQTVLDNAARDGLNVQWWLQRTNGTGTGRQWYNGQLIRESHHHDGHYQDPADGTAALRSWYHDGQLADESHYPDGQPNG